MLGFNLNRTVDLAALPGLLLFVCVLLALTAGVANAHSERPDLLKDVGIDQKLNQSIPLDLPFRDERGNPVRLRDYFGKNPVVLTLTYYQCPMLCTQILNGVTRGLQGTSLKIGNDFTIVTVSINPKETYQDAASKKRIYASIFAQPGAGEGWHFLTGDQQSIAELASAVGFRYAYDAETGDYAHASGIMILTPQGRLSRYFYGVQYPSRDLRLSLVEASSGKIGSPVDELLLFCFHYDPATGKYGLVIMNVIRIAGLATIMLIGGGLWIMLRREHATAKGSHV